MKGVVINGIKWATHNVSDISGRFETNIKNDGGLFTFEEAKSVCPKGWRLPNIYELKSLLDAGSVWTNEGREFGSGSNKIFLSAAGFRYYNDSSLCSRGGCGRYWSSTENGTNGYVLYINNCSASIGDAYRQQGYSVRCVAE